MTPERHLAAVPPYVTSPSYVLHVKKTEQRTLCGHRIERNWLRGSTLPKRKCKPCERRAGPPMHEHVWGEWSGRFVLGNYEKRYCECGSFQARPVDFDA